MRLVTFEIATPLGPVRRLGLRRSRAGDYTYLVRIFQSHALPSATLT